MAATSPDASLIIVRPEALANPENVAGMSRFGIRGACVLGVPVKTLRVIARETGRNHDLAEALWASGIHEARILASIVADPKRVDLAQMERSSETSGFCPRRWPVGYKILEMTWIFVVLAARPTHYRYGEPGLYVSDLDLSLSLHMTILKRFVLIYDVLL